MARLSKRARAKIPTSQFAIPEKRKYPINTRKRAGRALGLVGMHGTATEKRRVRAAVRRKYGTGKRTTRKRSTARRRRR
jgi:hypothetical protein